MTANQAPWAQSIGYVTVVVREYDEAIAWYTGVLGFNLVEDTRLSADKRWVLVAPPGTSGASILLARHDSRANTPHRHPNRRPGRVLSPYG
jgi:catechol 2,3-dioxygenase-like lactoylglutathione lyase family enzyme